MDSKTEANSWFGITSKSHYSPPNPNDDLICDNCINRDWISAKDKFNRFDKNQSNGESPMDIQNRWNAWAQSRITEKVQQRIKNSESIASKLPKKPGAKELWINDNENGTFFWNDPKVLCNDILKQKALERFNRKEQVISSFYSNKRALGTNPEKAAYYENCVDNYHEPIKPVLRSYHMTTKSYNQDLNNQIANKQKLNGRVEREEEERIRREQEKEAVNHIYRKNQEERKKNQLQNEYIDQNRKLIYMKHKKQETEKIMEINDHRNQWEKERDRWEQESERKRALDEMNRRQWNKELEKQIREKEKLKNKEKMEDRRIFSSNNNGECSCSGNGTCSVCKKSYPLTCLNKRQNYMGFGRTSNDWNNNNNYLSNNTKNAGNTQRNEKHNSFANRKGYGKCGN